MLSYTHYTDAIPEGFGGVSCGPPAVQIDWRQATMIERNWPALAPMAAMLGLSDADLDALFVAGAKL